MSTGDGSTTVNFSSDSFTVTQKVVDVCDPPTVAASTASPTSVAYTIGDSATSVTVPAFTVNPNFCTIAYTQTAPKLADGSTAITPSANKRDFSVAYTTKLTPAVNSESTTVKITAAPTTIYGSATGTISASVSVAVTYKNPCIDKTKISISAPANLTTLKHIVGHIKDTYAAHAAYTISASPTTKTLCRSDLITYTAKYDNKAVASPVFYTPSTRVF